MAVSGIVHVTTEAPGLLYAVMTCLTKSVVTGSKRCDGIAMLNTAGIVIVMIVMIVMIIAMTTEVQDVRMTSTEGKFLSKYQPQAGIALPA